MTRLGLFQRRSISNLLPQPQTAQPRTARRKNRRRLAVELLENRRVLAVAVDLATIQGVVTNSGDNVDGASVQLYRDNGDNTFDIATDTSVTNTMTAANGQYQFPRQTAGSYFVRQPAQTIAGRSLAEQISPLISISGTAVQGQIIQTIDAFTSAAQSVSDTTADGIPVVSSIAAPQVIGGERDLFVNKTSATGSIQLSVNDPLLPDLLSFDSAQLGDGQRRISWDGPDGTALTIDDTGLAGIDLTQSGTAAGVRLQVGADSAGGTAIVRIYSDDGDGATATRFSTATLNIPDTGGTPSSAEFLPFTSFVDGNGGGGVADLNSVGAIEIEISGSVNVNGTVELVGTIGPTVIVQNLVNVESADLSLTKTVDNATPSVGQNVTFTITVDNAGPSNATNVQVSDLLPAGLTFVSSTPSQGTYDEVAGVWDIGSIVNATNATLAIVATPTGPNVTTNTAQVSQVDQADPDSTPGDGVIGDDDLASVEVSPQQVDVSLSKTIDNATPNVGQNVTFTVTAANQGPNTATGVVVRDVLPGGMTLVSATASQGNFNTTTGLWSVGSIVIGATPTLTIVASVDVIGPRTNTAEVTAVDQADVDSTPDNQDATEDDQASVSLDTPIADLSLTKTASNLRPNVGDAVSFTIALANAGPAGASGVTVTDVLPAGIAFVSSTVTAGDYDASTGIWTVGDVAVGATPSLTINARLENAAVVTNTARIATSNQFDPDSTPGNDVETEDDQETITLTPRTIDLSLTKTVDVPRPSIGQNVVFTITAANAGPDAATGVVISDTLPAGLVFVSANPSQGNYDNGTGLWTVGDVTTTDTPTLQITAQFTATANTTNIAQVNAANEFDIDSTPDNSVAIEDDQASISVVPANADLSLTKTVNTATPNLGDTVTFTITATNDGPDDATGVVVRDLLPADTTFVDATPSTGSYNETTGLWTVGTIASGTAATLTIRASTLSTNLVTNTAEIIAAEQIDPDSSPNNNDPTEDDQAVAMLQSQQIDLSLTKTIDNARPNLGDNVTFTITVTNAGPSGATGVVVTDTLPVGLTLVNSTPSQGSFNTSTGGWNVGALTLNGFATLTLVASVDALGSSTNTAHVTAANQVDIDSTPGNNVAGEDDQASVDFAVPIADLSLTKTASNSSPNIGENVTFRITLQNTGPDQATGVRVTDILPAGLAFVSTSLSTGSYDPSTGIWSVGSIVANGSETLDIVALVETQGAKTNTARVTTANEADPDSTPGNNDPNEDDQAQITLSPPQIDLSLTKTASVDRPSVGQTVDFVVTVSNAGPDPATGVAVTDLLPAGFSLTNSSVTAGSYNATNGIWTVGELVSGGSQSLTLTATVDSIGVKTNIAEVTAANQFDIDSTPGNDVTSEDDYAIVSVTPASADLSLEKTISNPTPNVGSQVTFTLTARNAGPDAAANVVVTDTLPAGLSFVGATPSVGSYDPATRTWTIPTLDIAGSATLDIIVTVDSIGDKTNTAEITSSSQFDPDSTPGNAVAGEDDIASATLTPQLVDLALSKMIDEPRPSVGDTIEYTVTLTNAGPSSATGVVVTDLLPSGVQFVSSTPSQGTYNATSGLWSVGTVASGDTPTLVIRGSVLSTGTATNTAEVTAADQTDSDSTPGNGVVTEDDIASVSFTTPVADLALTKIVNDMTPDRGENITFTLNLSNSGPDAATGVTVRDQLPPGLTFVSATPGIGTFDAVTGIWTVPRIENGDQAALSIVATVTSGNTTTNRAEVLTSRQFDPDSTPGNSIDGEDDMASVNITPNVVDVSVSASVDNDTPMVGDTIAITINAENAGPATATGVSVSAPVPAGLTLVSANPGQGSYDPSTSIWFVGPLQPGVRAQLILNATVDVRGVKELPVQVITTDQFDVDSTPNNDVVGEDDQTSLLIRAPRLLSKRLFLSR